MRALMLPAAVALAGAVAGIAWIAGLLPRHAAPAHFASAFVPGEAFQFDPPVPGSYDLPPIKRAPDGVVLDIAGRKHSLAALTRGKISLVSFIYLMCGDVNGCPLATATLYDIYDASARFPVLRDHLQLVTVSFDPERDTVEAIAAFHYPVTSDPDAGRKIRWEVLTTSGQDALQPILDGYGQTVHRSNDQETIKHLLRIFLVDGKGIIRNVYGLGFIDPRLIMTDVETLMMEEGAL